MKTGILAPTLLLVLMVNVIAGNKARSNVKRNYAPRGTRNVCTNENCNGEKCGLMFLCKQDIKGSCGCKLALDSSKSLAYLVKKWRNWYKSVDVNHDGTLSWKDAEKTGKEFTDLNHIKDKPNRIKGKIELWFQKCIFRNGQGRHLTEQEFVNGLAVAWIKDKTAFKKEMQQCMDDIFDSLDVNRDGFIETKEYIKAFKAYGHDDENLARKEFEQLGASGGKIPVEDIANKWAIFTASDDPGEEDVINAAFELGL